MTPVIFAAWLRLQGHRVVQTESSFWVEAGPRIFQAFPYHCIIMPSEEEIRNLLVDNRSIAVRYSTPIDANAGIISYHVTYEKRNYSLETLPKKARYDVKKGLAISSVEPLSFLRLANEGWELRQETLVRQGRVGAENEKWWKKLCLSAENLIGFEAWGALVKGKMVASLIAFSCDDYFTILYQQSLTDFLPYSVNNALAYYVTAEVIKRPGSPRIFYGLHSLDAPPSVDAFKFRMGYSAKPVRQRVVFHPFLRPLIFPSIHTFIYKAHRLLPSSSILAKFEGILRFYLQGQQPLSMQILPEPLRGQVFLNS